MGSQLKPIMFVGTCSDAGKSIVNTAFCRIFKQDGYSPAPFKAQNMSLNSFSTIQGGEMGRAQVVQAEACGIEPHTDMNPVLLKPNCNRTSQVILNGRPVGTYSARDYFNNSEYKTMLFEEAKNAFQRLSRLYNPIVLEGAGSISELNLKDRDITNMRMAMAANASTYLVADIDRGGLFGSVYGTIMLLDEEERAQIKGIIINKFRGDPDLFAEGKKMIEDLTGVPVVGIIPWFDNIIIEEEDSVALKKKQTFFEADKINLAVVRHNQLSNFTDFDNLERDTRFNVFYSLDPEEIEKADVIVLPGSKTTIADMQNLWETGVAQTIINSYSSGKKIIGICGGYQMMGQRIIDPEQLEGGATECKGLGLLPQYTTMEREKVTVQCKFDFTPTTVTSGSKEFSCKGYEIHQGKTEVSAGSQERSVAQLSDGRTDGYFKDKNCWGTYIHGILDNQKVINFIADDFQVANQSETKDFQSFKEEQYDKLASLFRENVDMEVIYKELLLTGSED